MLILSAIITRRPGFNPSELERYSGSQAAAPLRAGSESVSIHLNWKGTLEGTGLLFVIRLTDSFNPSELERYSGRSRSTGHPETKRRRRPERFNPSELERYSGRPLLSVHLSTM